MRAMQSLDGQVAIVTGAASGIGLGIATVLRAEGAAVVVADLDADRAAAARRS
jgi:NAD(P)-dependent dehydrogenase (short-subunit alcohol dehydrogenase family)